MEHLRNLISYFKEKDHERVWPRASEELIAHVEEVLLPHLLRIVKKDNTLLAEVELFPGIKVDSIWDGSDDAWKKLQMTLLYAVLHGDPKEKFGTILETIKGMLPGGTSQADEISKIIDDEETQSSLKEMLDLVMNTRLASIIGDIIQSIEYSGLEIDFDDPEKLLEMAKNPGEHPVLKELMERAQFILEDRIKSGKINQQELIREIEMLRAKFQSSFGKYLNEMVVGTAGNTTGNTAQQILSNSPEARRARMLARLQKKQQQKVRK